MFNPQHCRVGWREGRGHMRACTTHLTWIARRGRPRCRRVQTPWPAPLLKVQHVHLHHLRHPPTCATTQRLRVRMYRGRNLPVRCRAVFCRATVQPQGGSTERAQRQQQQQQVEQGMFELDAADDEDDDDEEGGKRAGGGGGKAAADRKAARKANKKAVRVRLCVCVAWRGLGLGESGRGPRGKGGGRQADDAVRGMRRGVPTCCAPTLVPRPSRLLRPLAPLVLPTGSSDPSEPATRHSALHIISSPSPSQSTITPTPSPEPNT